MAELSKEYYEHMAKFLGTEEAERVQIEHEGAGEVTRMSQVREEMANLSGAIEEHGIRLDALMGRLQPVFRIEAPTPTASVPEERLVELANAIRELRHRVEDQTGTLMDALTLIEL